MKFIRRKVASAGGSETKTFLRISKAEWVRVGQEFGFFGDDQESLFEGPEYSWERSRKRQYEPTDIDLENEKEEFGDNSDVVEESDDDEYNDIRYLEETLRRYVENQWEVDDSLLRLLEAADIKLRKGALLTKNVADRIIDRVKSVDEFTK